MTAHATPPLATTLDRLEARYGAPKGNDCRRALDWILWENVGYLVDDERRAEAFAALKKQVGLDAEAIRDADAATLLKITRMGGIHPELRADRLREIADLVIEEFDGDLDAVLKRPYPKALSAFKKFPSIGTPGAEKVLLFTRTHPVLALESNGLRALTRLGYGVADKSYDKTYRSVREAVARDVAGRDCDWLMRAHRLFRRHGQELCKNTQPKCLDCPVQKQCAWFRSGVGSA